MVNLIKCIKALDMLCHALYEIIHQTSYNIQVLIELTILFDHKMKC